MRASFARRAQQVSERFLTPHNPTGLAGLLTHPYPRPALISIYRSTLEALQQFPQDSAYRTSVEAITKHRLNIIENVKPEGYEKWAAKTAELRKQSEANPNIGLVQEAEPQRWDDRDMEWDGTGLDDNVQLDPRARVPTFLARTEQWKSAGADVLKTAGEEWQRFREKGKEIRNKGLGEVDLKAELEKLGEEIKSWNTQTKEKLKPYVAETPQVLEIAHEPPLTAQQVSELEERFGAGLLEEVIEVAEGELKLVQVMQKAQVWEELAEKAPEGQWSYFERVAHVKGTQKP